MNEVTIKIFVQNETISNFFCLREKKNEFQKIEKNIWHLEKIASITKNKRRRNFNIQCQVWQNKIYKK